MTGPQGNEPGGQWAPQPGQGQETWQPPQSSDPSQPSEQGWQPAYGQGYQYPQQQPGFPGGGFGAPEPFGQQPGQPGFGPPSQFGQPGQYGQPGVPPQFGAPAPQRSTKTIAIIAGIVTLAVAAIAVLVTAFLWPAWAVTTTLDITKAQDGVKKILTDETNGYGAKNVSDVKCNNGENPEVVKDKTFDCDVTIDGSPRHVTVRFTNDKGTYEVQRPR